MILYTERAAAAAAASETFFRVTAAAGQQVLLLLLLLLLLRRRQQGQLDGRVFADDLTRAPALTNAQTRAVRCTQPFNSASSRHWRNSSECWRGG